MGKGIIAISLALFSYASAFASTERHDVVEENVAATSNHVETFPIVPNGSTVRLRKFGGFDPNIGDNICGYITLQWGNGGSFETIRSGGCGSFEFQIARDFVGDGSKRFRIVLSNNSLTAKDMIAWAESLVF